MEDRISKLPSLKEAMKLNANDLTKFSVESSVSLHYFNLIQRMLELDQKLELDFIHFNFNLTPQSILRSMIDITSSLFLNNFSRANRITFLFLTFKSG